jgi:hydroxymethylpyrimidine pyrophosphatase-like HAD family hydrolase
MPRSVPDGEPATAPPTGARALLATDLDGTLLGADAQLSLRTRRALAATAGGPVEVVVVTGRPPMFLTSLLDGADIDGEALCANGSMVVDLATMDVLQVRAMPADTVRAILAVAAATAPPAQIRAMLWRPGHEGLRLVGSGRRFSDEVLAALAEGWLAYKVLVGSSDAAADPTDFLVAMDAVLGAIATVTHSMPGHPVVEIGPRGVDKGTALAELAAARGVQRSSVHAVGDMPNDLPMLRWAGRSYAVANAHQHVLAEVDFHLGANTDDAVAGLLERLHRGLMAEPEV